MPINGSFNQSGSPVIDIEVSGPIGNRTKFTAMVDTGFSGFLLLPILSAFPIGLLLRGIIPITLADGTTDNKLACVGAIHFDGQMKVGLVIIEWNNTDVLVGMDFLRKFGKQLVVDPTNNKVELANAPTQSQLPLAQSSVQP